MLKRIEIEALLRWAYRDELPKAHKLASFTPAGFGGAWGGTERYGELLTIVDLPENEFGLVPDLTATTMPHADAIRVHNAVCDLDTLALDLPEDWNPLGDWPGFAASGAVVAKAVDRATYTDRDGQRRLKTTASRLIRKYAVMGDCPVWEAEEPTEHVVCGDRGKPLWFRRTLVQIDEGDPAQGIEPTYLEVEVDGMNPKSRVPYADAYRKTYFEPDPVEAVLARAEYEVWHAAMALLVEELNGYRWHESVDGQQVERLGLRDFLVTPSTRPERPWECGGMPEQRVLHSLDRPQYLLTLCNGFWGVRQEA